MLKYTFETKDQELKTWVDPENGSLNVQVGDETVNVPYEIGAEMVAVVKHKQSLFYEAERKKASTWNKFMETIFGKDSKGTLKELHGRRYEVA